MTCIDLTRDWKIADVQCGMRCAVALRSLIQTLRSPCCILLDTDAGSQIVDVVPVTPPVRNGELNFTRGKPWLPTRIDPHGRACIYISTGYTCPEWPEDRLPGVSHQSPRSGMGRPETESRLLVRYNPQPKYLEGNEQKEKQRCKF